MCKMMCSYQNPAEALGGLIYTKDEYSILEVDGDEHKVRS